jgi:hypothetical protein
MPRNNFLTLMQALTSGETSHADNFSSAARHSLPGFADLVFKLVDELPVAVVGNGQEGPVDPAQSVGTPRRNDAEQQRSVGQRTVRPKRISGFVDLASVVLWQIA